MAWEFSLLVVANVTAGSDELLDSLRDRAGRGACAFTLVMPASGAEARDRLETALARMREAGLDVEGKVGDPDPVVAVMDVWDPMKFDEIIVSTLPRRFSRWLRHDLITQISHLGLPVTVVTPQPRRPSSEDNMFDTAKIGGGGMLSG